jgi:hypothetical protein
MKKTSFYTADTLAQAAKKCQAIFLKNSCWLWVKGLQPADGEDRAGATVKK